MAITRIAAYQMKVAPTKAENRPRILDYIQHSDADFIVFPEMALTGHHGDFSASKTKLAWEQIETACRQHYKTVILGTGSSSGDDLVNQIRIFSPEGETIGKQKKLVPTQAEREWCTPGDSLECFTHGGLVFGCLVSNDFWVTPGNGPYPDRRLSYQLGEKGAQVIFVLADVESEEVHQNYYESNLILRAREANAHIVFVNTAQPINHGYCASGVLSPTGEWLARATDASEQTVSFDYGN